ncbi:diacylglycerol kinase [Ideonella sp. DXS29W]|uniref:Diacylglycerol kinase n=1 Tax=Ideonella lacteola TaxID=2984193 RepID=A0ABU9BLX6_9BURK
MSTPLHPIDTPPPKSTGGFERLQKAWANSVRGLSLAFRGEKAFRQEVAIAAVLVPLAFWVGRSWVEVALLCASVWLVMIVELLNSAIEAAIDRIGPERHELSGRAKDVASAAVWMSLVLCGGIWAAALWARFHTGLS